jgi:hypothetical protein
VKPLTNLDKCVEAVWPLLDGDRDDRVSPDEVGPRVPRIWFFRVDWRRK